MHPGEVLLEEFLGPRGLSQYRLARYIGVPPRRINEIVDGTRAVSADKALRLVRPYWSGIMPQPPHAKMASSALTSASRG